MPDETTLRNAILDAARTRQGMPYRLDPPPDGTNTIDCSLYVLKTLADAGVPLPGIRTAEQIRQATVPIGWDDVRPGDLVFFEHTYDAAGPAGPDGKIASHIGISLGKGTGRMWDANEARGVGVTTINPSAYWQPKLFDARRIPALVGIEDDGDGPPPSTTTLRGIDVASYQGSPDWAAVAASGIAFAFTKATEGTDYLNPTFARNWLEIRRHGMVRGAYHYARPEERNAARSEADYFLANVLRMGELEDGDMVVLDLEPSVRVEDLAGWAVVWLDRVKERTGVAPIVYTGAWVASMQGLAASSALGRFPLWLAAYQEARPSAPAPWGDVVFWQYSDRGAVPGIVGNVDMNVFNGSPSDLRRLGKGGQAPVAVPDQAPTYAVGPGLMAAMQAHGDQPATDEIYVKSGGRDAYSEAYGRSGARYVYLPATNATHRYDPAA